MLRQETPSQKELPEELKEKIALSVDEELFWAAANLIQAEEHLLQTLYDVPANQVPTIGELIATIRSTRVQIMKRLGVSNPKGQVWCMMKHLISAAYRLMEASEKSITQLNDPIAAREYSEMARILMELFLIGGRELIRRLRENEARAQENTE
ncbi:MAG: hypothetical protein DRJ38_01945 [Thermoprotei archaeon]|nr:MAG: hypothetical protein DRJ38_01945 [Thermoprotei archaeon]